MTENLYEPSCGASPRQGEYQQAKSNILKAVAHPIRLSIVEMLGEGERCACKICDAFSCDRTTVSKHLAVLKSFGVVEDRKEGLFVFYRLKMPCLLPFLACLERVVRKCPCPEVPGESDGE
ncbi:MAG TPA: metalloregulator ArsR/SmtB family transcription factor [Synergistaceae bacterium]|nr:metalloregulator ArsR/SmtB family transcription factor [Synergistaceae bacterium]